MSLYLMIETMNNESILKIFRKSIEHFMKYSITHATICEKLKNLDVDIVTHKRVKFYCRIHLPGVFHSI